MARSIKILLKLVIKSNFMLQLLEKLHLLLHLKNVDLQARVKYEEHYSVALCNACLHSVVMCCTLTVAPPETESTTEHCVCGMLPIKKHFKRGSSRTTTSHWEVLFHSIPLHNKMLCSAHLLQITLGLL